MKLIEDRILKDGHIINDDILKVDSFLNHQIDVALMRQFALEAKEYFKDVKVDKVLTIETSGIAVAYPVAEVFNDVPLVFAKKSKSQIVGDNVYKAVVKSFTRGTQSEVTVDKKYLLPGENVLIVDDFLAEGNASLGLADLIKQAGANPVGVVIVIEKSFQEGRKKLENLGLKVFSGARIKAFENNKPIFMK